MKPTSANAKQIKLQLAGGNTFGRYNKISDAETINMIVSDGWLVPYAGYEVVSALSTTETGRAIYNSDRWGNMIAVVGNSVYGINPPSGSSEILNNFFIGTLETYTGDVFIDEDIYGNIAICDGTRLYIYNWQALAPELLPVTLPTDLQTGYEVVPGYVTYQDGYFLIVNKFSANWYLSKPGEPFNWTWGPSSSPVSTSIQTKPTNGVAILRAPGRGNLLFIFGTNVTEMWYDVGAAIFPYQRSTSVSIDYGCLSPNTISAMDTYVAWLGTNEKSGPVIMISSGADITKLSTDGIDFKLSSLTNPEESFGFFFKQDGHLFYQLTFSDPTDNYTLVYDFNTKLFSTLCDENMNYHIAERVAFFADDYYFTSINDGNIYRMDSQITNYNYTLPSSPEIINYIIPRIRICPPIRGEDAHRFCVNSLTFTIEQGNDPYYNFQPLAYISTEDGFVLTTEDSYWLTTEQTITYRPRVDLSLSKDGATSFGSQYPKYMNPLGDRKNRMIWWQLGSANDLTVQLRFYSESRIVATEGIVNVY